MIDRPAHYPPPRICALAVIVAVLAAFSARLLTSLIDFFTNLAFHHRLSIAPSSPWDHPLGAAVILVPAIGGLVVGVIARWGSPAVRGHGIPESMERVLLHESRIPGRVALLKPVSAAISIGTGGPFGAEGPIIATGSALGSLVGQWLPATARERKTLLAAGAAAGMTATFGSPISAVLLAVELLLFELSPETLVPVSLAAGTAAALRMATLGSAPVFPLPSIATPGAAAVLAYGLIGALLGAVSMLVTRAVYAVEDAFEKLPVHWMWWPALGGIVVGFVGWLAPRTLGVGYANLTDILSGALAGRALAVLCAWKLASWLVSLGSGTSGGTLAPLFTVGGAVGGLTGAGIAALAPFLGVEPRLAALVGMAAIFAGASRAMLASALFAFETTREAATLLPLLVGCAAAHVVSSMLLRPSIMTLKIERRGVHVPIALVPHGHGHATAGAPAPLGAEVPPPAPAPPGPAAHGRT